MLVRTDGQDPNCLRLASDSQADAIYRAMIWAPKRAASMTVCLHPYAPAGRPAVQVLAEVRYYSRQGEGVLRLPKPAARNLEWSESLFGPNRRDESALLAHACQW